MRNEYGFEMVILIALLTLLLVWVETRPRVLGASLT